MWYLMGNDHKPTPADSGFFVFACQSLYVHSAAVQSKTKVTPSEWVLYYTKLSIKVMFCLSTLFSFSSLSATYFRVSIYLLSAHPPGFLPAASNLSFVILSDKLWLPAFSIQISQSGNSGFIFIGDAVFLQLQFPVPVSLQ